MATALKKSPALEQSDSLEFLVNRDNGGDYYWEIVGGSGERLSHSGMFASHDEAARAARFVYEGAGSARFEPNAATRCSPEAA